MGCAASRAALAVEIDGATKCDPPRVNAMFFIQLLRLHQQTQRDSAWPKASNEQRGNREAKKPKKEKIKTIAAAPSQKTGGWQPTLGPGKKK
jgi:hypothetical protein